MAILERITQLRQQGLSEAQIIQTLKEEGISPKDIHNALSQSNVKSAVTSQNIPYPEEPSSQNSQESSQNIPPLPTKNLQQPSNSPPQQSQYPVPNASQQQQVMQKSQPYGSSDNMPRERLRPSMMSPGEDESENYQMTPQNYSNYNLQQDQGYSQGQPEYYEDTAQGYQDYYPEYDYGSSSDIEAINDIAEQIVEEKNAELKRQIEDFSKFRKEMALIIERLGNRLQKVENAFSDLQMAIISKMGDYGKDVSNIAKEMHASQESFSKILDPLTENIQELRRLTKEKAKEKEKS